MEIVGRETPESVGASGLSIRAPTMTGTAESVTAAASQTRGGRGGKILYTADTMKQVDIVVIGRLEIDLKSKSAEVLNTRGGTATPPAVLVPPRDDSTAYAVRYLDDNTGADIWVFPNEIKAGPNLVFDLPETPEGKTPPVSPDGTRAIVTKTMRGLVTVVAWVTDPLLGMAASAIAKAWENKRRPYALHQVAKDGQMGDPDWSTFNGDPVLLLVHGTFSTPQAGFFGWLGGPDFTEIHKRYDGRCLALSHPTMHTNPVEDVAWLLDCLPKDKQWKFDTVSHSRGGLVVRELAARANEEKSYQVNRMVMVAPPNFGTPLANAQHWTTFLNVHTNILTYAPDTVTTVVSEGLLCLVKIIGGAAVRGLSGIAAMNSEDSYLQALVPREYSNPKGLFVIAADYAPSRPEVVKQLVAKAADAAVDKFFNEPNDMVVPTLGCSEGSVVSAGFPVAVERLVRLTGPIHHCNLFEQDAVRKKIAEWLA